MPSLSSLKDVLLNFKPPSLDDSASDPPPPAPSPPLQFLDRHIPGNMALKRVEILPSLPDDLSSIVDAHENILMALSDNTFGFSELRYNDPKQSHAQKTLYVRNHGISSVCCRVASSIILHPENPSMQSLFTWFYHRKLVQYGANNDGFVVQNFSLHFRDFVNVPKVAELIQPFDEETKAHVTALFNHSPFLAVGTLFCPSAHGMLADMGRLADAPFPWRLHSHCKTQSTMLPCPPDAPTTLWNLPRKNAPRRSARLNDKGVSPYRIPDAGNIVVDDTIGPPLIEDFVQKAWTTAVHLDTTLIVFDCGNLLRIGIRSREQQTLFLSNSIDIRSDDPAYGRLWLGFHISAAFDALERLPLLVKFKSDPARSLKRTHAVADLGTGLTDAKRTRLVQKQGQETSKIFSRSSVMALFFQWGEYNSPAPLILWSPGTDVQQKYGKKEYLCVVIDSKLGTGATGDVYTAKVHSSRKMEYSPCIVKMANVQEKIERLRQEHRVYAHLTKSRVAGIPTLFGFYENHRENISILVLANAGLPIALQMDTERRIHLKDTEITEVKAILNGIHAAGILHRDIRSWNILTDKNGCMRIIDFDRASFSATEQDFADERERLAQMTAGEFVDDKEMIGNADTTVLTA